MPHRDPHHRSDPETTFDTWLDAFVAGTPANGASQDDPSGPLTRAQAGARQLHGLAAQAAMPGTAVQQRIREDLMQSGALAPGGGRRWIPERRRERQVPWWSPISPFVAAALAIAVIVGLVASLVWMQRPVSSPGTSDAPGFAVASPEASPSATTTVSDLLVLEGATEEEAKSLADHVALIDEDGLTINQPNGDTIELPGVISVETNNVPGQAIVTRNDESRAVINLTTGDTLFDLPSVTQHQSWAGPYLFSSESGDNADWTVHDTRTGDSRGLSEIVDLPDEPAVRPEVVGAPLLLRQDTMLIEFCEPGLGPANPDQATMFVIAGSLESMAALDGYPPAPHLGATLPVFSDDGTRIAWGATSDFESYRITVVDTTTGEELASIDMTAEDSPGVAGFLDSETLVITTPASVGLLTWANGEPEQETVVDGLGNVSMPLLHAASQNLYVISAAPANGAQLTRISLQDGTTDPIMDIGNGWFTDFTTAGSSWIFLTQPSSAALIDASSGEVVSRLPHDAEPEPQYSDTSVSTSFDGSTVLHHYSWRRPDFDAYLLSPRFSDGLVLSAPVDPELIDDTTMQGPMPVVYTLSADGTRLVVSIADQTGLNPQMIGTVAEDPGWTGLSDDIKSVSWLPMPAEDAAPTEPQRLPAQDFATPFSTSETAELSCSAPGYRPVVRGQVDPENLAMIGGEPIRFGRKTTITAANGTEITFDEETVWTRYPGNDRVLVSGASGNEMHTVTSLVTGDSWTFPPPHEDAMEGSATFMVVGEWLIGPTDDDTDMLIVNLETGQERLVSDILGRELAERGQPLIAPWSDRSTAPTIMAFMVTERPTPALVLPSGDLNDAYPLPAEHTLAAGTGVISSDGSRIAYVTKVDDQTVVRTLDGFTGEQIAEYEGPVNEDDQHIVETIGLTADETKLVLRDDRHVWTVDLDSGEMVTAFEAEESIISFEFDHTTGTALAGTGTGRAETPIWLNPATGEMKELEFSLPERFPTPQNGWAMVQTRSDFAIAYSLLDMATGELASDPVTANRDENAVNTWITDTSDGLYIVHGEPGTLLVLDGPGGQSFTISAPGAAARTSGIAISVSPNQECIVYTQVGTEDEPGASWIAPLEPDAEWTELPFELSGWLDLSAPQGESQPTQDGTTPASTPEPSALQQLIPEELVPVMSPAPRSPRRSARPSAR